MLKARLAGAAALLASFSVAVPASADVIYSNDFQSGSLANLSGVGATIVDDGAGQKWAGYLNLQKFIDLTVDTSGYTNLVLSFSLRALDSLDGNYQPGPDGMIIIGNNATLLNATFHYDGVSQSYTGPVAAVNDVNGFDYYGPDRRYDMTFSLADASSTMVRFLSFADQNDEGFGIDNIVLTGSKVSGAVPEPATWALMILGFGAVGQAMRRRRITTTRRQLA